MRNTLDCSGPDFSGSDARSGSVTGSDLFDIDNVTRSLCIFHFKGVRSSLITYTLYIVLEKPRKVLLSVLWKTYHESHLDT
jgi:hypothetical protein